MWLFLSYGVALKVTNQMRVAKQEIRNINSHVTTWSVVKACRPVACSGHAVMESVPTEPVAGGSTDRHIISPFLL